MAEDETKKDFSEQIVEDIPNLKLEDIIGEYRVITKRVKSHHSRIKTYETRIIFEGDAVLKSELLSSKPSYKIYAALDIHEAKIKEIAELLGAV